MNFSSISALFRQRIQTAEHRYNVAMKYRYRILCVFILTLSAAACTEKREIRGMDFAQVNSPDSPEDSASGSAANAVAEEIQPEPLPHPKSIPGLRNRDYSPGSLQILGPVPAAEGLRAWEFSYESDGFTNYGLIEQPDGEPPAEGWPVIVLAHGYIPPSYYSTTESYRLVTRHYAAGGFMVVKPDYRGHGRSEGGGPSTTRTVDYTIDVLNLIAGLNEIPDADAGRLFLYGHSMGGEIGLRILTVNRRFRGAVLWASVTEPFPENTLYFIRKRSPEEAEELKALIDSEFTPEDYPLLSPRGYFDSISVPLLVHHGTADESVPFEWSVPFRRSLDEAGVNYEFFEYPGEDHNISRSFYRVMDTDMEFFRGLME